MMRTDTQPWYRQFWPWFLIALPGATVVGCMVTIWLAVTHPDIIVRSGDAGAGAAYQPQSDVRAAHTGSRTPTPPPDAG